MIAHQPTLAPQAHRGQRGPLVQPGQPGQLVLAAQGQFRGPLGNLVLQGLLALRGRPVRPVEWLVLEALATQVRAALLQTQALVATQVISFHRLSVRAFLTASVACVVNPNAAMNCRGATTRRFAWIA